MKLWNVAVTTLAVTALVATALDGPAAAEPPTGTIRHAGGSTAVAGSYIVVLKEQAATARGTAAAAREVSGTATRLAAEHNGGVARVYSAALRGFEARLTEAAAQRLAADPAVDFVEQNHTVQATDTQANPPSWGLDRIDQRQLPLDSTYRYPNQGAGVTAYIIDSGMRFTHTDFQGRVTSGLDAVDGGTADDCYGHGTRVGGTVGGAAHGVAKQVSLVSVRVLDCDNRFSTWATVIAGVDWVTANAAKPAVANLSLTGTLSTAGDNAISNLIGSGVTVVVAAANDNADACTRSPARVPAAITVGATTNTDARASYSNYGTCVDLFAPGHGIVSATMTSDTSTGAGNGTSMATPHVAGAAALLLTAHPTWTPAQVQSYLVNNATTSAVTDPGAGSPNRLLYGISELAATPPAVGFVPFPTPVGVLDTRSGTGGVTGTRGPASMTTFPVAGVGGIPADASAVVARVAVTNASANTFIEVWPDGRPRPGTSIINVGAGENISNLSVVPVGATGDLTVYNSAGTAHLIIDVQGYYTGTGNRFVPVGHTRVVDTRNGTGTTTGTIPAGGSRTVTLTGDVVPAGATAVAVNLLVPGATAAGSIAAAPAGTTAGRNVLNYLAGATQSGATVTLAADGRVTFVNNGSAAAHLSVTVQGYFTGSATGALAHPTAVRLINTRTSGTGAVPAGGTLDVRVAGVSGVPASAVAAALNLTVTGPEQAGHLQAWPVGAAAPSVSVMDFKAGIWRANAVIVTPGTGGYIRIKNGGTGAIHVIVDLQAWFA